MISFSGFLFDQDLESPNIEEAFAVHSCGHYRLINREEFHTIRPVGRKDYQMIYVASGLAHFLIEGEEKTFGEGSLILFKPLEPQDYWYTLLEYPEIYWIHFGGDEVVKILEKLNLTKRMVNVGLQSEYKDLFEKIIRELIMKRSSYLDMTRQLVQELFILFSRYLKEMGSNGNGRNEKIDIIIERINKEYGNEIKVEVLARNYGFSTCWFINQFKEYTGYTPLQYITKVRLGKAKELLHSNVYNISEIAELCGYNNPLYFSRIFKKYFGNSPKEYREGINN